MATYSLDDALREKQAEERMNARFAGQPFMPCTLKDQSLHDAGRAFMARDANGDLHLIGSNPSPTSNKPLQSS